MLFYVCNIIINYNSKCTHPSYGARLMFCWTDFCFPWHQDQRGYKKYLTQNTPSLRPHFYCLVWNYINFFFQFVGQIHEKIRWNKILTKIYEIWNQMFHFILFFFIYHSFQFVEMCMYMLLKCFCNLNFSDSEDIYMIIGWSRTSLNSIGVGFWRQIVFLN